MARQQMRASDSFEKVDPVWNRIRREAEEAVRKEPELATFIYSTILHHDTLEGAVVHRVALAGVPHGAPAGVLALHLRRPRRGDRAVGDRRHRRRVRRREGGAGPVSRLVATCPSCGTSSGPPRAGWRKAPMGSPSIACAKPCSGHANASMPLWKRCALRITSCWKRDQQAP